MVIGVALIGVIGAGSIAAIIGAIITDLPATRPLTRHRSRFDQHFVKSIEIDAMEKLLASAPVGA
jgi:hypothetical protein